MIMPHRSESARRARGRREGPFKHIPLVISPRRSANTWSIGQCSEAEATCRPRLWSLYPQLVSTLGDACFKHTRKHTWRLVLKMAPGAHSSLTQTPGLCHGCPSTLRERGVMPGCELAGSVCRELLPYSQRHGAGGDWRSIHTTVESRWKPLPSPIPSAETPFCPLSLKEQGLFFLL